MTTVIDWALARPRSRFRPTKLALAGHSLGGKITVLAATLDPRVTAVVAWDPVDSNTPSVAPELMVGLTATIAVVGETTNGTGGFMPCAPTADNFQYVLQGRTGARASVTVTVRTTWTGSTIRAAGYAGSAPPELRPTTAHAPSRSALTSRGCAARSSAT